MELDYKAISVFLGLVLLLGFVLFNSEVGAFRELCGGYCCTLGGNVSSVGLYSCSCVIPTFIPAFKPLFNVTGEALVVANESLESSRIASCTQRTK